MKRVMKPLLVPLAEQIAAVQEHIAYWKRRDRWGKDDKGKAVILGKFDDQLSIWPAVLATLQQHERALALVDQQANDDGLWFAAQTAPEAYLQQELRKLHAAIEGIVLDDAARRLE
jgi:hypothetical protein